MIKLLKRTVLGLAVAAAAFTNSPHANAARDLVAQAGSGIEIVVIEVNGCKYCPLFRQSVVPAYAATPRARDVPIRFIDINAEGADRLKLKSPIATVPTSVVMRNHVEVGRIEGFVGAEDFARLISSLLASQ
ncbi:MAG: hypothetical protein Q7T86_05990 [Hyphomicrobiaceae bacterium]|nr:hypothetical protein [Hyphomicrobiaceae bacterium]